MNIDVLKEILKDEGFWTNGVWETFSERNIVITEVKTKYDRYNAIFVEFEVINSWEHKKYNKYFTIEEYENGLMKIRKKKLKNLMKSFGS